MQTKRTLPGTPFWIENVRVRRLSLAARGLLIYMLALAASSPDSEGHDGMLVLKVVGEKVDRDWLSKLGGFDRLEMDEAFSELVHAGVAGEINGTLCCQTESLVSVKTKEDRFNEEDVRLANFMLDQVRRVFPETKATQAKLHQWAEEVRKLRELDGHDHREIAQLFAWANRDSFWGLNIRSPKKLREQWSLLSARRKQAEEKLEAAKKPFVMPRRKEAFIG